MSHHAGIQVLGARPVSLLCNGIRVSMLVGVSCHCPRAISLHCKSSVVLTHAKLDTNASEHLIRHGEHSTVASPHSPLLQLRPNTFGPQIHLPTLEILWATWSLTYVCMYARNSSSGALANIGHKSNLFTSSSPSRAPIPGSKQNPRPAARPLDNIHM